MKRKRLEPGAVQAFLTRMHELANSWSSADHTVSVEDAMHLWAVGEIAEDLSTHHDHLEGEEARRAFRRWLRTEPTRILQLIDAARRRLSEKRPAK